MIATLEKTRVNQAFEGREHTVTARRAVRAEWIGVGDDETMLVGPGDWIVMLDRHTRFVLPDSVFRVLYRYKD